MRGRYATGPTPTPAVGTPITWGGLGGKRVGTVTHVYPDGSIGFDIDDEEALAALGVPKVFQAGTLYSIGAPSLSTSVEGAWLVPPPCGWRGFAGEWGCVLPALHEGKHSFVEPEQPPVARARCAYCLVQRGSHGSCGRADCSCPHR